LLHLLSAAFCLLPSAFCFMSSFEFPPPFTPPGAGQEAVLAALMDELVALIERRTLMLFGAERRTHFVNTLLARARQAPDRDLAAYIRRVMAPGSEAEMMALIDDLTINETSFFRNVPQMNLFARVALPEVLARKRASGEAKRITIWSAACSTGQEVYTLGMLAYETLRFWPPWEARVLGTDLSPTVIKAAQTGLYPKARLDAMPPEYLARYFDHLGDQIRIKEVIQRLTSFQQHNLRDAFPPGPFDIIFCRNVMIYFSREEQTRLAHKFKERLAPQGFLFIGHSESLQGLGVDFRLRLEEGSVAYQKG